MDEDYKKLLNEKDGIIESNQLFVNNVLYDAEDFSTASTIVYYTNFGQKQHILSFSVPYDKYEAYHRANRPYWGIRNLTSAAEYISSNETIITQIVEKIRSQTNSEEELANALLNFVQDKGHSLSVRYYPTLELKYPIETLVEMGGDCDTHSFLYATLMKAAGFKVLLLYTNETLSGQYHAATAIHLVNPPKNSLPNYADSDFVYNGEKYYYAEPSQVYWRVGDLPPIFKELAFNIVPI
jgi:transglutaminase-like putative cysteine protease